MSNSGAWGIRSETLVGVPEPATRLVNMNQLGRALTEYTDPRIAVLFVYNCNPLSTVPDQNLVRRGLSREDLFTVVHDMFLTDSADYADIVLPATSPFEHDDAVLAYGGDFGSFSRRIVEPLGEAKSNAEVFRSLGKA